MSNKKSHKVVGTIGRSDRKDKLYIGSVTSLMLTRILELDKKDMLEKEKTHGSEVKK